MRGFALSCALSSWLLLACAGKPLTAPGAVHPVPTAHGFLGGVAVADITPPLHLSLFGHGPEGRIATGVRLRLECKPFVVARDGVAVALVPCDLQAPSLGLQRDVAKKLQEVGVPISEERLFIMATHTHAAPGHYFESRRYSGTFSSQAPGYDAQVREFLVERISAGISEAYGKLAPVCLEWKQEPRRGLTFNRSYVPFLANEPSAREDDPARRAQSAEQRLQAAPSQQSTAGSVEVASARAETEPTELLTPAEHAVDPTLSVLALYQRASGAPACEGSRLRGVLAVYGMHPTGAPNTNELYHGDIFGFAARVAEGRLSPLAAPAHLPAAVAESRKLESAADDAARVIVGLANGVEGDVSPKIDSQSLREARKHGRWLGSLIADLVEKNPSPQERNDGLQSLYWDLTFPEGRYGKGANDHLCEHGELGMVAAGGARDGPTRVRIIPAANAGFQPVRPSECHGQKVPLRNGSVSSPHDYPQVGPIGLLRIGNGVLATVPGEMTTMTGDRIRRAIRGKVAAEDKVVLVGLTNQYFQYFATHEEYPFQYYEGASTLYGQHSEQFLVRYFDCLAAQLMSLPNSCESVHRVNEHAPFASSPEPQVNRWPAETDVATLSLQPLNVCKKQRDGELGWEMEIEALPLTFTMDRSELQIAVLFGDASAGGGDIVFDDDRGASVEVREVDDDKWRIRWLPDLGGSDARCGQVFRLAVRGRVSLTSRPFTLRCDGKAEPCVP